MDGPGSRDDGTDRVVTLSHGDRWLADGFEEVPTAGGFVQSLVDMSRTKEALRLLRDARIPATLAHLFVRAAAIALARTPGGHCIRSDYRRLTPGTVDIGLSMAGETSYAPVVVLPASDRKPLAELVPAIIEAVDAAVEKEAHDLANMRRWGWLIPFGFMRRFLIRCMNRSLWFRRRLVGTFQISYLPHVEAMAPFMFLTGSALGVGGVRERPVAANGQVVVRPTAWITLCADHAALDGARAADLLGAIQRVLESDELVVEARAACASRANGGSGIRHRPSQREDVPAAETRSASGPLP